MPRPLRSGDIQRYRFCDELSGWLICAMVIFSPWAFGTTQPWSIWTMNICGYLLGVLLAIKSCIRWRTAYLPPSWFRGQSSHSLSLLSLVLLAYCLISAVNARATFHRDQLSFAYHDCVRWLPHSLDSTRTWHAFWNYLALACSFWATRDWLLGKTESEERAGRSATRQQGRGPRPLLPARLRRLLWVMAINGGLLALEGIAQRLEGSGCLLFLVKPRVNPGADTQFGPYAYRANASQYFNLVWPVCLGLWWMLNRASGSRGKAHHVILASCAVMAACPIISTSRGGAMITVGIIVLAALLLLLSHFLFSPRPRARTSLSAATPALTLPAAASGPVGSDRETRAPGARTFPSAGRAHRSGLESPLSGSAASDPAHDRRTRNLTFAALLACFACALGLGFALGWKTLEPRMAQLSEGFDTREQMYHVAYPMAEDYPVFGTGPGTFESVFQLYRISTGTYWPAQLHNDWLETRITFGWVGSALIGLAFLTVLLRWFTPGGIHGGRRFMILIWLALAGCLVHARYDFPFQIYSIVFLFLILCSILSVVTRKT